MQLVGAQICSSDRGILSEDEIFWQGQVGEDDSEDSGASDKLEVCMVLREIAMSPFVMMPPKLQSQPLPLRSPTAMINLDLELIGRIDPHHPISNSKIEARRTIRRCHCWRSSCGGGSVGESRNLVI